MALHLYRRHRRDCAARRPYDARSGEFEERRKGWKRCGCFLYVSGTLAGQFGRRTTDTTTWDAAHRVVAALEAARSWDGLEPVAPASVCVAEAVGPPPAHATLAPPGEPPPVAKAPRLTIARAIEAFLVTKQASVAASTFRKHKTFTQKLRTFADGEGYVMLDQVRPEDVDVFYARSRLGPRAKGKMLEWLRSFFQYAVNRDWLAKSPVSRDLKPPKGAARVANKVPFSDEQLADVIKACDHVDTRNWRNRFGTGQWTGDDLKDFVWLLTYTGLRISDAVLFDIERLQGNEVFLRAKKNGGDLFMLIPDWLRDACRTGRDSTAGSRFSLVRRNASTRSSTRGVDTSARCSRSRMSARSRPRRIVSGIRLRGSCSRRACRWPTSRTSSGTTNGPCASTTRVGYRSGKPGSPESWKRHSGISRS